MPREICIRFATARAHIAAMVAMIGKPLDQHLFESLTLARVESVKQLLADTIAELPGTGRFRVGAIVEDVLNNSVHLTLEFAVP